MFPSWVRAIVLRLLCLALACFVIVAGGWMVNESLGQNQEGAPPLLNVDDDLKAGGEPIKAVEPKAPNPAKDDAKGASNAKDAKATPPKEPEIISLAEAIILVERTGKGKAVKAELVGEGPATQFNVELVGKNNVRTVFQLSANGRVIVENTFTPKKKGKGGNN
jgi:hypothetical protein